jgi:hypothetical protein
MVQFGEWCAYCFLEPILMIQQAGVVSKWTNDGQRFLLEHFDIIHNSPSHIYHSALPLSPSSSWLSQVLQYRALTQCKGGQGSSS